MSTFLSQSQKSGTCLQVDGGTWLTVTLAIFSDHAEIIKYTTRQVFHLTGSVGGSGAVACVVLSTYSGHKVAVRPWSWVPWYPGRIGHTVEVASDSLRLAWSYKVNMEVLSVNGWKDLYKDGLLFKISYLTGCWGSDCAGCDRRLWQRWHGHWMYFRRSRCWWNMQCLWCCMTCWFLRRPQLPKLKSGQLLWWHPRKSSCRLMNSWPRHSHSEAGRGLRIKTYWLLSSRFKMFGMHSTKV